MTPAPLRTPLGFYPTPLHPLDRLTEAVKSPVRIWMKRDDHTGLALGGNKVRKLEYLLADAERSGATTVITWGGRQSNHCRQTAAAAAKLGFRCIVIVTPGVRDDLEYQRSGNVLLDHLLGADVVELEVGVDPAQEAVAIASAIDDRGERAYIVALGGSTALGALGYADAAAEILASGHEFSAVFLPSGSGGTQAGLLAGLRHQRSALEIVGVSVGTPAKELVRTVHGLAVETGGLLGGDAEQGVALEDVQVDDRQIGDGYGHPTAAAVEAIDLTASTEGILLDPVYTGKAMAALLAAIRAPAAGIDLGSDILFLHTGGQPGLFAYRAPLTERRR